MNGQVSKKQTGQSIILVAVVMVALVIFAAVTVDMSNAYYNRRTAQNAADAAALAGAEQLGMQINADSYNSTAIDIAMNDFAERNGIEDTNGVPRDPVNHNVLGYYLDSNEHRLAEVSSYSEVPPKAVGIEAVTFITAPTYFGGIVGFDGYPLQAEAAVVLEKICGASCVVPIATYFRNFEVLTDTARLLPCYNIWNGQEPGNFGWLNWRLQGNPCHVQDCDAPCLRDNLDPANPCNSGFVAVDDWVAGSVGKMPANFIEGHLRYYIDHPQPFTVVVWDTTRGTGCNAEYHVVGFARMQLLGYQLPQGNGTVKYGHDGTGCNEAGWPVDDPNNGTRLTAYFIEWVDVTASTNCHTTYGTVRSPRLTK